MGGAVCFWDKGIEKPHEPMRERSLSLA